MTSDTLDKAHRPSRVHALFDFEREQRVTTVEALAQIAFELSRGWQARRAAKFTRFTLGMIAVQTPLDGKSRERDSEVLRASIDNFSRSTRAERVAARVQALVDTAQAAELFVPSLAETLKRVLPALIRTIARQPLKEAKITGPFATIFGGVDGVVFHVGTVMRESRVARKNHRSL